jgi:uncharacterized protein DUF4190
LAANGQQMKFCPQCNRQYDEPWISFCSDDGTMLIEQLSPPADPNFDPRIRGPKVESASEQETQWLPREPAPYEPPAPGAWVPPDERPPLRPPASQVPPAPWQTPIAAPPAPWQPPPPPLARPNKQPAQGLALASMIVAIVGLLAGSCFGPVPAIVALILGLVALQQIKKSPDKNAGRPYAVAGIVISSLTIAFYVLLLIWFLLALVFGNS